MSARDSVFTPELILEIIRRWPHQTAKEIAVEIGVTERQVANKASYLGLLKDKTRVTRTGHLTVRGNVSTHVMRG